MSDVRLVRCAIYTRKSSDEGLEQSFNSLDAQREACESYIASQKHEGWQCLPARYDDGGFSGGTLERPALKALMGDLKAGKVDLIVVYKIDRLTRSLMDFSSLVTVFDTHKASFVSVTQHFNTTTSMGQLTLNVLLSFAQFEREVTGERIRDKIAASKRKGMWMGGRVPLGYKVVDRLLLVHDEDATFLRQLFVRYLALGSVAHPREELKVQGLHVFSRGALYLLLQNRLYLLDGTVTVEVDVRDAMIKRKSAIAISRSGGKTRVLDPHKTYGAAVTASHATLLASIARGRSWYEDLIEGRASNIADIAHREGVTDALIHHALQCALVPAKQIERLLRGEADGDFNRAMALKGFAG